MVLLLIFGYFFVPIVFSCEESVDCEDGKHVAWCETFGECGEGPPDHECGVGEDEVWCTCQGNRSTFHCPPPL